jgi:hypothetical protein
MDELDYWRLCDELNVVQAALLIVGEDPSTAKYTEAMEVENRPKGYEAAKTAITHALIKYAAYRTEYERVDNLPWDASSSSIYDQVESHRLNSLKGSVISVWDTDFNGNPYQIIQGSIELWQSTVDVAALKVWLKERGFSSGFFFPVSDDTPDYLDPRNPRYAPKLAAAVHAWQAVTDSGRKSPKQALEKWLREHASEFGLTDDEGQPVNQAVEDCSKVANWQPSGGAPKTPG